MDRIFLKNIRCFVEPDSARLAPITIIVGENSTGKSTLLGSIRLIWQAASGETDLDFNAEPFEFGGFDQVSNYRGGRAGRAKEFELGFSSAARIPGAEARVRDLFDSRHDDGDDLSFRVAFVRGDVQPALSRISLASGRYKVVQHVKNGQLAAIALSAPSFQVELTKEVGGEATNLAFEGLPSLVRTPMLRFLAPTVRDIVRQKNKDVPPGVVAREYDQILLLSDRLRRALTHEPMAFAPVRTKPQRTYNPSRTSPDPEGNHAPMVLASRFFSKPDEWEALKAQLEEFGKNSGLFASIDIRPLGRADGDPFQVTIQNYGAATNLADVGYGVSQALPIIVDGLTAKRRRLFLVQQPEVHLHPRGQAALATFFASLIKTKSMRFIIETHSDHLVDRIRFEIREGRLKSSDVSLIYLERHGHPVNVHNIGVDARGNLINAPSGYRSFFLEEEERLMSGAN